MSVKNGFFVFFTFLTWLCPLCAQIPTLLNKILISRTTDHPNFFVTNPMQLCRNPDKRSGPIPPPPSKTNLKHGQTHQESQNNQKERKTRGFEPSCAQMTCYGEMFHSSAQDDLVCWSVHWHLTMYGTVEVNLQFESCQAYILTFWWLLLLMCLGFPIDLHITLRVTIAWI